VGVLRDNNDDLPDLAAQFRAGQRDTDPLLAEFLVATVYVERDESGNGPLIHERPDRSRWVHAYSTREWLPGADVGQDVDCASMTGQHLVALLPADVGIRLDEGHPHAGDLRTPTARPSPPHPDAVPELVRAARAVHVGAGGRDRVLAALRSSQVFLGRTPDGVPIAMLPERQNWLCVFSSLALLHKEYGHDCEHMVLGGNDLLTVLLPALAVATGPIGVFIDLGADHQLSLSASLIAGSQTLSGSANSETSADNRRWWRL
jgi:hypothetical protein